MKNVEIYASEIKTVLTEYLSDELANALTVKIGLEIAMRATKEIETENEEEDA